MVCEFLELLFLRPAVFFTGLRLLGLVDKHSLAPTSPNDVPSQRSNSSPQYTKTGGQLRPADKKTITAVTSCRANRRASGSSHSQAYQGCFFRRFRTDFVDAENI